MLLFHRSRIVSHAMKCRFTWKRIVLLAPRAEGCLKVLVFHRSRTVSHAVRGMYDTFAQYESGISYSLVFSRRRGANGSASTNPGFRIPAPVRRL